MSTNEQQTLARQSGLTLSSSKFSAAIGISPYKSRAKLWREMTGREQPDSPVARMQWGKHNEWRAVAAVEALTGLLFDHTGDNQRSLKIQHGRYSSTPDGSFGDTSLEVKCPEKCYEEIPLHYMPQVQGQMLVAGFSKVYFACWGHQFFRCWLVERDANYINEMGLLLAEFLGYLDRDEEPPRLRRKPELPAVNYTEVTHVDSFEERTGGHQGG